MAEPTEEKCLSSLDLKITGRGRREQKKRTLQQKVQLQIEYQCHFRSYRCCNLHLDGPKLDWTAGAHVTRDMMSVAQVRHQVFSLSNSVTWGVLLISSSL